jgi:hypothetical protein
LTRKQAQNRPIPRRYRPIVALLEVAWEAHDRLERKLPD